MINTPSSVSRRPASPTSRSRTRSGSDGERKTSKRSSTAVATLLTFCPPGPEARMKVSTSSSASTEIERVTGSDGGIGRVLRKGAPS